MLLLKARVWTCYFAAQPGPKSWHTPQKLHTVNVKGVRSITEHQGCVLCRCPSNYSFILSLEINWQLFQFMLAIFFPQQLPEKKVKRWLMPPGFLHCWNRPKNQTILTDIEGLSESISLSVFLKHTHTHWHWHTSFLTFLQSWEDTKTQYCVHLLFGGFIRLLVLMSTAWPCDLYLNKAEVLNKRNPCQTLCFCSIGWTSIELQWLSLVDAVCD